MIRYYTQETTQGYTDEELDVLNRELCDILADARAANDDQLTPDQEAEIIKAHNHQVAQR